MVKTDEKIIDQFRSIIPDYKGEKILIAVSGGIDSMVCASVFKKYNYPITIAHCNFNLRQKDSLKDAEFVGKWAKKKKIPCLEKSFKVKKEKGKSVQMTARDLRYEWFQEIAFTNGFTYIITAHHLDDSIETVLMNIIRGTGINGLTGIPARNGNVVRPMIGVSKKEIENYARKIKLKWRVDKSNLTTKYNRNKIRLELIPMLQSLNPSFIDVFYQNMLNWQTTSRVYKLALNRMKTEMVNFDEAIGGFKISVLEIIARGINAEILYELIAEFGFNSGQAEQINLAIHTQPGKKFYSKDHALIIDRLFIIIKPIVLIKDEVDTFQIDSTLPFDNHALEVRLIPIKDLATLHTGKDEMLVDFEKIHWPVRIRKWAPGDKFTPMGMKGKKKVSDFLTDIKLNLFEKNETWVAESGKNKILGIIGYRPDENFKISKKTKHCLYIRRKTKHF